MLHLIMPNQISGPNTANRLIFNSYLRNYYDFDFLTQNIHSGNKFNIRLLKDLIKQIHIFNPDLVHVSGLQTSGFYAILAAKLKKKKVLIAIRGFSGSEINVNPVKKFMYNNIIEPFQLLLCDYFYTVSESAKKNNILRNFSRKNLGFIHNSAPVTNFQNPKIQRSSLGLFDDDFILIYTGRVTYDKGISFLCEAMKKVKHSKIKLIIVGEGPYSKVILDKYMDMVGNQIIILGKRNDVLDLLRISDVFIFPTLHENLSNSLLEACSVGLPAIVTNVGGNPEVIVNEFNGLLIAPQSDIAIVNAIEELYLSPEKLKEYSKNTKQQIENKFSQAILLEKLKSIYDIILSKKRA